MELLESPLMRSDEQAPSSWPVLTLQDYQQTALLTDQRPRDIQDLVYPLLGLLGETGSLLSEVKKKQRDSESPAEYEQNILEEVGDVLWYLSDIASRLCLKLADLAVACDATNSRSSITADLTFAQLQPRGLTPQDRPTSATERVLLDMASEVGLLITEARALGYRCNPALRSRLSSVMRALVAAASEAGVTLEQAARQNLCKVLDRWPIERTYPPLFDDSYSVEEQLPRYLTIDIFERCVNQKTHVVQRCNGITIGDQLTDNITNRDDYRFHDAFHYGHAAVLGWSPTLRALLKLKRKSHPEVDESEDGARAIVIEEGVATWVFGRAKELNLFSGVERGNLPFGLLKSVRQFVTGYEAHACPLWLWEEAILQGYDLFRHLKSKRRARVHLDLMQRRLHIEDLASSRESRRN
jgi:NTP pyrophosphatase (non-canonical NTP hydrolase)